MPIGVSEAFFTKIGRIAVLQSHIEGLLRLAITNLDENAVKGLDERASFKRLARLTRSLLKQRGQDLLHHRASAEKLLDRAFAAEERRNAIVHSLWTVGPTFDATTATRLKLSGDPPERKAYVVELAELQSLREEMTAIVDGWTYLHPYLREPTMLEPVKTADWLHDFDDHADDAKLF
jgi:hypothetical protein